jgi:hypothetical protein
VAKEGLGGTQLYAKGWSDFTKYYDINAIPRFLVFDQQGKIVTVDSPRPSQSALKELLLNTLAGIKTLVVAPKEYNILPPVSSKEDTKGFYIYR